MDNAKEKNKLAHLEGIADKYVKEEENRFNNLSEKKEISKSSAMKMIRANYRDALETGKYILVNNIAFYRWRANKDNMKMAEYKNLIRLQIQHIAETRLQTKNLDFNNEQISEENNALRDATQESVELANVNIYIYIYIYLTNTRLGSTRNGERERSTKY